MEYKRALLSAPELRRHERTSTSLIYAHRRRKYDARYFVTKSLRGSKFPWNRFTPCAARKNKKTERIQPRGSNRLIVAWREAMRLTCETIAKAGAAFLREQKYDDPSNDDSLGVHREKKISRTRGKGTKALVGREDTARRRGAACH